MTVVVFSQQPLSSEFHMLLKLDKGRIEAKGTIKHFKKIGHDLCLDDQNNPAEVIKQCELNDLVE